MQIFADFLASIPPKEQLKKSEPLMRARGTMRGWIQRFICGVHHRQNVVGNRVHEGVSVTQEMYDNKDRMSHVCPFVHDSIDQGVFWIEESLLDGKKPAALQKLLREQMESFPNINPAYDMAAEKKVAPHPVHLKALLTYFPEMVHVTGKFALIDDTHKKLKIDFMLKGLMLGQFYKGCGQGAVYNDLWKDILTSPYPAFAIRYMAPHDHLFIPNDPNSPHHRAYKAFFA